MDPLLALACEWGLIVVEDAAQSIGSTYKGKPAGSFGDFGCFSFFPSKNLGGMGDGGMVVTPRSDYVERLRMLRVHGSSPKYYHKLIGMNSRLDTIQAAILLVKWPHLARWTERRRQNAAYYSQRFSFHKSQLITPFVQPENYMVYNQYCVRTPWRDELRQYLHEHEIGTEIYYPLPLHLQECFADLDYSDGSFPEAEKASREILALPVYPELTAEQLAYVVDRVDSFIRSKARLTNV